MLLVLHSVQHASCCSSTSKQSVLSASHKHVHTQTRTHTYTFEINAPLFCTNLCVCAGVFPNGPCLIVGICLELTATTTTTTTTSSSGGGGGCGCGGGRVGIGVGRSGAREKAEWRPVGETREPVHAVGPARCWAGGPHNPGLVFLCHNGHDKGCIDARWCANHNMALVAAIPHHNG